MANTFTGLIPDMYEAMDVVSRELTGLIPAVTMNASAERAALGEDITTNVEPAGAGVDITPAMTIPEPADQASGNAKLQITKSRAFPFKFTGDELKGLNNGIGYQNVRAGKIAQSIRACVNEVETDLAGLYSSFSRSYGVAGTTPFSTANDYTDASNVLKILKDNGSPQSDNQLVIDTSAGANFIGKQSAVNAAGTDSMLRQGVMLDLAGMPLRESAQINTPTKGTGTSYTSATTGFAVGTTSIPIITGSGTVLAGDSVTFTGDTNRYIVTTGVTAAGTIVIAEPGLIEPLAASAVAMTIGNTASQNMCFNRSAIHLAARAPAIPEEGDQAVDSQIITDPRSGLSMEFSVYKGYKMVRYEVGLAWGVANIKPEHTAILLG